MSMHWKSMTDEDSEIQLGDLYFMEIKPDGFTPVKIPVIIIGVREIRERRCNRYEVNIVSDTQQVCFWLGRNELLKKRMY